MSSANARSSDPTVEVVDRATFKTVVLAMKKCAIAGAIDGLGSPEEKTAVLRELEATPGKVSRSLPCRRLDATLMIRSLEIFGTPFMILLESTKDLYFDDDGFLIGEEVLGRWRVATAETV